MRCPTLDELPPPPRGKIGWPWTKECERLPATMLAGFPWPRVTVVTPSYNQGEFLEETLRSVLLQGYPNLEYVVIDGGSTDESTGVIQNYARHLAHWVSEPDRGQPQAINKGWGRATGDILAFLNSDDVYTAGSVAASVEYLQSHPETELVYASAQVTDERGNVTGQLKAPNFTLRRFLQRDFIPQPTVFFRRSLFDRIGPLDESIYYWFDYEYWMRAACVAKFGRLTRNSARMRMHPASKTCSRVWDSQAEFIRIFDRVLEAEPKLRHDRQPIRRPYLMGLLYAAGLLSTASPEQRADALVRLRRLRPCPSIDEITYLVAMNDAVRRDGGTTTACEGPAVAPNAEDIDACQILPSLVCGGIISNEESNRIIRRVRLQASVRHAAQEGSLWGRDLIQLARRAGLHDIGMYATRSWWSEIARSAPPSRSVVEAYRLWREIPRALADRVSGSIVDVLSRARSCKARDP